MSGYQNFAKYYDKLTRNVDYNELSEYFDGILTSKSKIPVNTILDLACGTGSLSVCMAKKGYEVIGVDGSGEMLGLAHQKAEEEGLDILFLQQNMEQLNLYGTVDACICALDSLNHLRWEDSLAKTFAKVSLFLNPGGLFIFDLNTFYKHRVVVGEQSFVYETDDVFCVWQNACRQSDALLRVSLDFFEKSSSDKNCYSRSSEEFYQRVFDDVLVRKFLFLTGFTLLKVYSGFSEKHPTIKSERLVYIVRKDRQMLRKGKKRAAQPTPQPI